MELVCILKDNINSRNAVNQLSKVGFKQLDTYTTNKDEDGTVLKIIDNDKFNSLTKSEKIINISDSYGVTRPHGAKKYVIETSKEGIDAYKKLYGNQVKVFYMQYSNSEKYEYNMINGNQEINKILADILKILRNKD